MRLVSSDLAEDCIYEIHAVLELTAKGESTVNRVVDCTVLVAGDALAAIEKLTTHLLGKVPMGKAPSGSGGTAWTYSKVTTWSVKRVLLVDVL